MWTYIELSSTAEHDARRGVISSLATPGVLMRRAPQRGTVPPAASRDHHSRGWLAGGVRNEGRQAHEAQLVRLVEGVTVADLVAAGDDPVAAGLAEAAGGAAALAPGLVAPWPITALEPGRYALVCLLVDAASGRHLALGMAAELSVTRS